NIKKYILETFVKEDEPMIYAKKASRKNTLPPIEVPPNVGKLLYLLARLQRPKRILEIGTLGGYSALWLEKALEPDGKIITIEIVPDHIACAKEVIKSAGKEDRIEIREGDALKILDDMKNEAPFDLIFIDADKRNYPNYLEKILPLARKGTLILSDNLIPKIEPINKPAHLESERIYEYNQMIANHPRLESILISTIVGEAGRLDGLGLSIVK
ncbi:MAG: O-methyltransferase, partial [Parachlamydiaceae bacterium]